EPDRGRADMAITAATRANSRKEFRTDRCAINSQTGYTRIQVLHFGNRTSLGAQPGLPGGRGRQSTSIRCPGQSNKYGVPRRNPKRCMQNISALLKIVGSKDDAESM